MPPRNRKESSFLVSEVCVSRLQAGPGEHRGPADSPGARPEERRLSKALLYLSVKTRGLAPTGQGLAGGREGPAGAGGGAPALRPSPPGTFPLSGMPVPRHPSSLVPTSHRPSLTQTFWAMTPTWGMTVPDRGSVTAGPHLLIPSLEPTCPPLCMASCLGPKLGTPAASTPTHALPSTGPEEGPRSSTPTQPENDDKKVSCPFNFLPGKASRLLKQHFNLNSDSTFIHGAARSRHFIKGFNRFYKTCHIRGGEGANAFSLLPEFQQWPGKQICHENRAVQPCTHREKLGSRP